MFAKLSLKFNNFWYLLYMFQKFVKFSRKIYLNEIYFLQFNSKFYKNLRKNFLLIFPKVLQNFEKTFSEFLQKILQKIPQNSFHSFYVFSIRNLYKIFRTPNYYNYTISCKFTQSFIKMYWKFFQYFLKVRQNFN